MERDTSHVYDVITTRLTMTYPACLSQHRRSVETGIHIPYGITQCYVPPGRGDIQAFTPAEAGTRFSDPGGMQG